MGVLSMNGGHLERHIGPFCCSCRFRLYNNKSVAEPVDPSVLVDPCENEGGVDILLLVAQPSNNTVRLDHSC